MGAVGRRALLPSAQPGTENQCRAVLFRARGGESPCSAPGRRHVFFVALIPGTPWRRRIFLIIRDPLARDAFSLLVFCVELFLRERLAHCTGPVQLYARPSVHEA